jgi:4-hydroxythreonine-4-phosphate dehydrogenase
MGDPAGIGPEICVRAAAAPEIRGVCVPVVTGNVDAMRRTANALKVDVEFSTDCRDENATLVIEAGSDIGDVKLGQESTATGAAAASYIERAVELWRRGKIDAITTAPISKHALALAGYDFPGHTEFLGHLTGSTRVVMSFFADKLRIVLLSTHLSLIEAIKKVTKENILDLIEFSDRELSKLLGRGPRLSVAGLNPHASEGGMFGSEESREIAPAIHAAREKGIDVAGPFSPDTIFLRCYRGEFDAVIALYHDQATIPVKAFSFGSAVNVTLGLPLIRTSVDHGTAFDIAGRGIADASSMIAAVKLAAELVKAKHR